DELALGRLQVQVDRVRLGLVEVALAPEHPQLLRREARLQARFGEPVLARGGVPGDLRDDPHGAPPETEERGERELPHPCHTSRLPGIMPPAPAGNAVRGTFWQSRGASDAAAGR